MTAYRDEASLLAGLRAGERAAAEAMVDATYRLVFALLCRLSGGDRDLAADLTQETYRRAWPALGSFDGRSRLSTWLYRIATNTYLNHVRRPRLLAPLEEELAAIVPDRSPRQDEEAIARQGEERLRLAVLALPEALRFLVVAHFWGEVPVRELAAAEGVSQVAVRKRLHRAFAVLRQMLEEP
ncbi:MAG TPA: sigma-70 family RNA polymerase sigma factor [Thermoanaerobaculaceae bacterium]|nr:sigma-70 family RNA polymerase sigma factor [Thermoanaerobaculaceae bacterium]HRS14693.1 sigma-70 family RNA polymerase sigma factor [Thermoanaerobaculaceae bacterium]